MTDTSVPTEWGTPEYFSNHFGTEFFERAYRGEPVDDFVEGIPWEIGEPQPAIVELVEAGGFSGHVLDAGCGTGEHALYLAAEGYRVTGVDFSPTAIARATDRAARLGLTTARFTVADVLDLGSLPDRFDAVLDVGLLHCLTDDAQRAYTEGLRRICRAGAVVHVLAYSDAEPPGWGPRRLTEREVRGAFGAGWTIDSLRPGTFIGRLPNLGQRDSRAWLVTARAG